MRNPTVSEVIRINLLRIKAERELKNIDLAEMLNVSPSYITNILKGTGSTKRGIGQITLDKLCKGLNINQSEFYKGIYGDEQTDSIVTPPPGIASQEDERQDNTTDDWSLIGIVNYIDAHGTATQYKKLHEFAISIKREIEDGKNEIESKKKQLSQQPQMDKVLPRAA